MPRKHCLPRPKPPRPYPHKGKGVPFATRLIDREGRWNLAVDGGVEGIQFALEPSDDLLVTEIAFTFECKGAIAFGDRFIDGPALKRGLAIDMQSYREEIEAVFQTNRDLIEYASVGGFEPYDLSMISTDKERASVNGVAVVKATRVFRDGLMLRAAYGDGIVLTVQDDLTRYPYAICSVFGYTA